MPPERSGWVPLYVALRVALVGLPDTRIETRGWRFVLSCGEHEAEIILPSGSADPYRLERDLAHVRHLWALTLGVRDTQPLYAPLPPFDPDLY